MPRPARLLFAGLCVACATRGSANGEQAIQQVLDDFHDAASKADEERYFALFLPDGVFLGTDAAERWTREVERSLPRGAYVPFAAGPRVCLGKQFAMMEMRMILATLLQSVEPNLAAGFEPDFVTELSMHPGERGMQADVRFY